MAKKKEISTKDIEKEAAKLQEQRRNTIKDFNINNAGKFWIDPDKTPTEEDIEQAKKEFEDRTTALQEKKDYLIADKTEALRVAKFLRDFIKNAVWQKRMWVGVLNYTAEVEDFINECEKEPKDYCLEYGAAQFLFLMMENNIGVGYDAAARMANMNNEFVPIYDTLRDHMEWYNKEVENINALQQRWAAMAQGYYMVIIPDEEPEVTDKEAEVASQKEKETSQE